MNLERRELAQSQQHVLPDQALHAEVPPRLRELRFILRKALLAYLPGLIQHMEKYIHAYSAFAICGDGHYKIAARIRADAAAANVNVLYAWVGINSALLRPLAALAGETWAHPIIDCGGLWTADWGPLIAARLWRCCQPTITHSRKHPKNKSLAAICLDLWTLAFWLNMCIFPQTKQYLIFAPALRWIPARLQVGGH